MIADHLEQVWNFRRKFSRWWSTPEPVNCLRYAVTEAAEALDAYLRTIRPGDARNGERNVDVLDELADCAIMCLSALGPSYVFRPANVVYSDPQPDYVDGVVLDTAVALGNYKNWWLRLRSEGRDPNPHVWQEQVLFALGYIDAYPGMDLGQRIDARLERIKHKHVPETEW